MLGTGQIPKSSSDQTPGADEIWGLLIEPSEKLLASKRLSTGKALLSTVGVLKQITITNLSEQQQRLEAGVVLGEIHEIDKIADEDSP